MLTLGSIAVTIMATFFVLVCVFMILVILVQKPRGGGLVGAFGGQGAVQQAFGSKVGDLLTWFTVGCFTAFLLLAILLTWYTRMDAQVYQTPSLTAPATLPTPAAPEATLPQAEIPSTANPATPAVRPESPPVPPAPASP